MRPYSSIEKTKLAKLYFIKLMGNVREILPVYTML